MAQTIAALDAFGSTGARCRGSVREKSDETLVARARGGDREAFGQLYRRHHEDVLRVALRVTHNREDALDVLQRAFERAMGKLIGFRGEASFKTWVSRITFNLALNLRRDRARRSQLPRDLAAEACTASARAGAAAAGMDAPREAGQEERMLRDEQLTTLYDAVAKLPPKQRLIVELRLVDELPFARVADLACTTENAAKVSFSQAGKRLRAMISEEGP
jgi:RNA polymerase sigma-70 factor (ECF subfamily)